MYEKTCEEYRAEKIEIFAELCELEDDLVELVLDLEEYFSRSNTSQIYINNLPLLHNAAAKCLTTLTVIHRVIESWLFPSSQKNDCNVPSITPDCLTDCEFSNIATLRSILERIYDKEP